MSDIRPLPELAAYRTAKGMSRQDLAKALEVTAVTIWRWEEGKRRPDRRYVPEVSRLTGVPAAELLGVAE